MRNQIITLEVILVVFLLAGCATQPASGSVFSSVPIPLSRTFVPSISPTSTSAIPSPAVSPPDTAEPSLWPFQRHALAAELIAGEAKIPLPPPESGIPEYILHIAQQQLQHAKFITPTQYTSTTKEYDSFEFDSYSNDQLSMRCYWIGEEVNTGRYDLIINRIPMNTFVFCATGKADGEIPALLTIELGYYPVGFAPVYEEYEIAAEDEAMRKDELYVYVMVIPFTDGEEASDPWKLYLQYIKENRYGSGSLPRRADLGTIEIPFFPGAEWESGPITDEQQAAIDERKRIIEEGIVEFEEWRQVDRTEPREYIVYMPVDIAMMNQYILHSYVAPETGGARPTMTFYVKHPSGYYQGYSFAAGYSKIENIKERHWLMWRGENIADYAMFVLEKEIARGAVEQYTFVIE